MNAILPIRMTVDEFLRWSRQQERGRYELEGGRIVAMPAESFAHVDAKGLLYMALARAIAAAGLPFYAMTDGVSVRIGADRAYEPDALIAPLPKPAGSVLDVANPVAVFEVLSPSPASVRRDLWSKLKGYALVPSIMHYVVIDPQERLVFRYQRSGETLVATEELTEGTLRLDPPGLELAVGDLVPPPAEDGDEAEA